MSEPAGKPRECGGCTMCCRVLFIDADDGSRLTEAGDWCPHCDVGRGCRIYAGRPRDCRAFTCLWRAGYFDEADRPDRSKIMVSAAPFTLDPAPDGGAPYAVPVLEFRECAPGAFATPRAKRMIADWPQRSTLPVAFAPFNLDDDERLQVRGDQHRFLQRDVAARFQRVAADLAEGIAARAGERG